MDRWEESIDTWNTAYAQQNLMWTEFLPEILQVYRSTPHAGTGITPSKLMLNIEIATKLPVVLEPEKGIVPEERCKRCQEKLSDYTDRKRYARHHDLLVGGVVLVATLTKGKLTPNFSGNTFALRKEVSWSKWGSGNG